MITRSRLRIRKPDSVYRNIGRPTAKRSLESLLGAIRSGTTSRPFHIATAVATTVPATQPQSSPHVPNPGIRASPRTTPITLWSRNHALTAPIFPWDRISVR